ncbi:hydratase, partial [Aduncisulcus paluster]
LTMDYRNGIDVMTTETTCLSSIWCTDDTVKAFYDKVGRPGDFKELKPKGTAYYEGMVRVDMSQVEPMIALPFHPSNVYTIAEVKANAKALFEEIELQFKKDNPHLEFDLGLASKITSRGIQVDQGIIAGCAGGTYENIAKAADILTSGQGKPGF